MSFRNRPTLDRKHRPRWQDELRSQQLIVAGFAVAIAIAIGIFGATTWSSYYDNHLREVAYVGGMSFDKDALAKRSGIISAELQAKVTDLVASEGGANDGAVKQQIQILEQTLQAIDSTASDSLTTGAFMRTDGATLGISVPNDTLDKAVARRSTLPFQVELSIITVNALPAGASATAKPTDVQWAAAEKHPAAITVNCASKKPSPVTTPVHRAPCRRMARTPWFAKISTPALFTASNTAVVSRRLSTDPSSGRSIAASISSLSAGSISRASSALTASAFRPSP